MGRYNDNTGKWRNYVTKPMACTVEGTGGSTFGAGARYGSGGRTVEAIVINESKEEGPGNKRLIPGNQIGKVLEKISTETNNVWKKIEQETAPVESVQDKTSNLPEHLQEAFNKNYTEVMDKVEEKARFKSGA